LVCEATGERDLAQRVRGVKQKLLRALHPLLEQPSMGWQTNTDPERAREVPRGQAARCREVGQVDVRRQIGQEEFTRAALLPGRESTPRRRSGRREIAIGPSE